MSIKIWTTDINKKYIGGTQINKTYLGETVIYWESTPSNWLLNNLVSYYKMDTSWSFPDAHWSNNWTINGATFTASGKINWGYSFDWVNDRINVSTNLYSSTYHTTSYWVKHSSLPGLWVLWFFTCHLVDFWAWCSMSIENDWGVYKIRYINYFTTCIINLFYNFTPTIWTYNNIICQTTASWMKIFIDGVLVASNWNTWTLRASSNNFSLWSYPTWWNYFDWVIDEVWLWNKALTQTEITALYNAASWLSYDSFTS